MNQPHSAHLDADFSSYESFEAWCFEQDGGTQNTRHDLLRHPVAVTNPYVPTAWQMLIVPVLFWAGVGCLLMTLWS